MSNSDRDGAVNTQLEDQQDVSKNTKKNSKLVGAKRRYTGPIVFSADGVKANCSPDTVQSAGYKKSLSEIDKTDTTMVVKGVLLTHELEVRQYMSRRSLK